MTDLDGRLAGQIVTSLRCTWDDVALPPESRAVRVLIRRLAESAWLQTVLVRELDASLGREAAVASAASRRFLERATMLCEWAGERGVTLIQDSLFDQRSRRAASSGARAREVRRASLDRRLRSIAALSTLRLASPPRLVAVLPLTQF